MNILLAAGEAGGSRAIAPLIPVLKDAGFFVWVLKYGFLFKELQSEYIDCLLDEQAVLNKLKQKDFHCLIWASCSNGNYTLTLARKFKYEGIPTVFVLDNWSFYRKRLESDNNHLFIPDAYFVMDEIAFNRAFEEGIPLSSLIVSGNPSLAELSTLLDKDKIEVREEVISRLGLPKNKLLLAFVNEPFRMVIGDNITIPGHCGFTEDTVLASFSEVLCTIIPDCFLCVLPHPKEDANKVEQFWLSLKYRPQGVVIKDISNIDLLQAVHGVAGMASMLLYKAWLLGIPCLSMQPDCRLKDFRRFSKMNNMNYTDQISSIPKAVNQWFSVIKSWDGILKPQPELNRHLTSAYVIVDMVKEIVMQYIKKRSSI